MKKYILFGGCLLLLAYITSCDDGRIYEKQRPCQKKDAH